MRNRHKESVFPAALITKNRRILFVGGGNVAAEKIGRMVQFSWEIRVLSKQVHESISLLGEKGLVKIQIGEYHSEALEGCDLVFAVTDRDILNKQILEESRAKGIMVSVADKNWMNGDFIMPAIIPGRHGIASFSSGGYSCRTTRLVKNSLSRQIDAMSEWDLTVVGTSHYQVNLETMESLYLNDEKFEEAGTQLAELRGVHEFFLLLTCNRLEFHGLVSSSGTTINLIKKILGFSNLDGKDSYTLRGEAAMSHAAMVGAGIFSQTPGENHIVSQLKTSYDSAENRGWAGLFMQDYLNKTLHLCRCIRRSIQKEFKYRDVEHLLCSYMDEKNLEKESLLLIGSGRVGQKMAEELTGKNRTFDWAYQRTPPLKTNCTKAQNILSLSEYLRRGKSYDILILSLKRDVPYEPEHLPLILKPGGWAFDLGVPRNLSERWLETVTLINMEDLKFWNRRNLANMGTIQEAARLHSEEHQKYYEKLTESL